MSEATASTNVSTEATAEGKLKVNRQEFLNLAWLASLGFLVLEVTGISIIFSYPRFKEGEFGGVYNFGPLSNVPAEGVTPLNYPKVKMWITRTSEGLLALYKVCPHLGCLYGWNEQEFQFICPCHGSQYEHNGDYVKGPAPRSLDRFVIRIVDGDTGEVLAETPSDGGPVPIPDHSNAVVQIDTGDKILGETHD
ncbi:MAG: Rieske 2Fe-2S domain-containing protein [Anaerolineae bacterium]|nr:Rieske 2Fe-2S domain-containing protein [Anaerolineae bacterium]